MMPKKTVRSTGYKRAADALANTIRNETLEVKKMNERVQALRKTRSEAEQALVQAVLEESQPKAPQAPAPLSADTETGTPTH